MSDITPMLDPGDAVSQPHEIINMDLSRNEQPTEGEWKRALADRSVMETAYCQHKPDPSSDTVHIGHSLRGQRFVAVPQGATGVAFFWTVGGTKQ